MKKITTNNLALIGITAALYFVATIAIAPLGYNAIQLRLSEVMTLLAYINPIYAPGLILGCALSNAFSPFGFIDVIMGTIATTCAVVAMTKSKNLFIASLWPSVFNGIIIGWEIYYLENTPLYLNILTVMLGEFIVVTIIGYPLFKKLMQNQKLMEILGAVRK